MPAPLVDLLILVSLLFRHPDYFRFRPPVWDENSDRLLLISFFPRLMEILSHPKPKVELVCFPTMSKASLTLKLLRTINTTCNASKAYQWTSWVCRKLIHVGLIIIFRLTSAWQYRSFTDNPRWSLVRCLQVLTRVYNQRPFNLVVT
jgi:hypothetical protein